MRVCLGDTWMSLEDNYCGYLQTEASVSILGSILRQKDKETLFHCVLPKATYCECKSSSKQTSKYLIVHSEHCCCSAPQSCLPHGLQHARLPCPSLSPGVCPSSCSLHQWYHSGISSSDALFSFCPQSLPASGTMNHLFTSDDQSTGPASVLPVSFQGWSPLSLTGLISLLYKPR